MEFSDLDKIIEERIELLKHFVSEMNNTYSRYMPQLDYLRQLFINGKLKNLSYDSKSELETRPGDSGRFGFAYERGLDRLSLRISRSFRRQWIDMFNYLSLTKQEKDESIDNFILHELFHIDQNLTTARHDDITLAPSVLSSIDYHADANAVIAAFLIYCEDSRYTVEDWPSYYSKSAKSVLHQMYVFNYPTIQNTHISAFRFYRYLTWHFLYHRISKYNYKRDFRELQLMFQPALALRGIVDGIKVTRNWAEVESAESAKNKYQFWLAVPNIFGVPRIYRFNSANTNHYSDVFVGIFDGDNSKSENYFNELFETYPELVGYQGEEGEKLQVPPHPSGGPSEGGILKINQPLKERLIPRALEHIDDIGPYNPYRHITAIEDFLDASFQTFLRDE